MTHQQKFIVAKLLDGCSITAMGRGQIRLRDSQGHPIAKVSGGTFYWLNRELLRKHKGFFLINKSKVRQLHGNCFIKRLYKGEIYTPSSARNTPPHKKKPAFAAENANTFLTINFNM